MQSNLYDNPEALSSLVGPARVHRDVYVREEIFKLEMERIWGQAWVYVGHESQVQFSRGLFHHDHRADSGHHGQGHERQGYQRVSEPMRASRGAGLPGPRRQYR